MDVDKDNLKQHKLALKYSQHKTNEYIVFYAVFSNINYGTKVEKIQKKILSFVCNLDDLQVPNFKSNFRRFLVLYAYCMLRLSVCSSV